MTTSNPNMMNPHHDGRQGAPLILNSGAVLVTPGAIEALRLSVGNPGADGPEQHTLDDMAHTLLVRLYHQHLTGDWGECGPEDWATNDEAVTENLRILSAYTLPRTAEKVWLITEAGHRDAGGSMTTMLLPSEY